MVRKFYLIRFKIEQPLREGDDEFEVEQIGDDQLFIYSKEFSSSAILNAQCFAGDSIEGAIDAFSEDQSKLIPVAEAGRRACTCIGLVKRFGQLYLRQFKIDASGNCIQIAPDTILPIPPQDSRSFFTLLPFKTARGYFRGADIEAAKEAIREDRDLVPFAKLQDGVTYMCAIQDDLGNFYLRTFTKHNNQYNRIGFDLPLDWKFLQKIDEMTCDLEWGFQEGQTCVEVHTNDLETAINAYIRAIAFGATMIPVTDRLPDGTYVKKDMIFKVEGGRKVFVKRISIVCEPQRRQFYGEVRSVMTSEDKVRLDQLV